MEVDEGVRGRRVEHEIDESNKWMTVEVEDNWKGGTRKLVTGG